MREVSSFIKRCPHFIKRGFIFPPQLVSFRHHLLLTCSETSLLSRHYKQLLTSLGQDECHAHLRCVTFDPNTAKTQSDQSLEVFISKVKQTNLSTILDRCSTLNSLSSFSTLFIYHIIIMDKVREQEIVQICSF